MAELFETAGEKAEDFSISSDWNGVQASAESLSESNNVSHYYRLTGAVNATNFVSALKAFLDDLGDLGLVLDRTLNGGKS